MHKGMEEIHMMVRAHAHTQQFYYRCRCLRQSYDVEAWECDGRWLAHFVSKDKSKIVGPWEGQSKNDAIRTAYETYLQRYPYPN